ncbi:hypothetical protein VKT23_000412 [Stygiomarasmius scandens]|uniref:Uncharacterized protein n=1 Tax=Marasmiellus scandens TaxID=2682957 RepID=A0ABR1K7W6_9AGAR
MNPPPSFPAGTQEYFHESPVSYFARPDPMDLQQEARSNSSSAFIPARVMASHSAHGSPPTYSERIPEEWKQKRVDLPVHTLPQQHPMIPRRAHIQIPYSFDGTSTVYQQYHPEAQKLASIWSDTSNPHSAVALPSTSYQLRIPLKPTLSNIMNPQTYFPAHTSTPFQSNAQTYAPMPQIQTQPCHHFAYNETPPGEPHRPMKIPKRSIRSQFSRVGTREVARDTDSFLKSAQNHVWPGMSSTRGDPEASSARAVPIVAPVPVVHAARSKAIVEQLRIKAESPSDFPASYPFVSRQQEQPTVANARCHHVYDYIELEQRALNDPVSQINFTHPFFRQDDITSHSYFDNTVSTNSSAQGLSRDEVPAVPAKPAVLTYERSISPGVLEALADPILIGWCFDDVEMERLMSLVEEEKRSDVGYPEAVA